MDYIVYADGTQEWRKNGALHRNDDLPARICPDGTQEWYMNGSLHRSYGPAIISSDGIREWYMYGIHQYTDISDLTYKMSFTSLN